MAAEGEVLEDRSPKGLMVVDGDVLSNSMSSSSSRSPVLIIPAEIQQEIGSYLTIRELKALMTVNKEFDKNLQSIKAEYVVSFNLKDVVQKGGLERYLSKIQSENIIHPSKHLQVSLRLKGATDEDMSELIQFNDIKALNLSYLTGVTDAGVLGLASIPNLKILWEEWMHE